MLNRFVRIAAGFAMASVAIGGGAGVERVAAQERTELDVGYIQLMDVAPLAVAHELGYFAEEGLTVRLVAQESWRKLQANLESGELDAAQMLATLGRTFLRDTGS